MNTRFAIGTTHVMAKGLLTVVSYHEENGVSMMGYTLNGNEEVLYNKYVNVISVIAKYQKRHGLIENQPNRAQQRLARSIAGGVRKVRALILKRSLKFGVELELCVHSIQGLRNELEAAGINVVLPRGTHQTVSCWKLVGDGSIRTTKRGVELVSPPSTSLEELKIVCRVLKNVRATVNKSCGVHVHHEIKDLKRKQIQRIYNFYNKYQFLINKFMKAERNCNRYCRPVSNIIDRVNNCETKEELLINIAGKNRGGYYNDCRYYTLNLRSFLHYGTVEFRHHHGTIDFEEISNWILFSHKIIDRATEIDNDVKPLKDEQLHTLPAFKEMVEELGIKDTELARYYQKKLKIKDSDLA